MAFDYAFLYIYLVRDICQIASEVVLSKYYSFPYPGSNLRKLEPALSRPPPTQSTATALLPLKGPSRISLPEKHDLNAGTFNRLRNNFLPLPQQDLPIAAFNAVEMTAPFAQEAPDHVLSDVFILNVSSLNSLFKCSEDVLAGIRLCEDTGCCASLALFRTDIVCYSARHRVSRASSGLVKRRATYEHCQYQGRICRCYAQQHRGEPGGRQASWPLACRSRTLKP